MLTDIQMAQLLRATQSINGNKHKYKKMLDYARGITDIITEYPQTDFSNDIVNVNFVNKFIGEECAFAIGNPLTYASKSGNQQYVSDINEILSFIDSQDEDYITYYNMLVFGESYELYYTAEDEDKNIVFYIRNCTPLDSRVIYNDDNIPTMFIRQYTLEVEPNQFKIFYDVYTRDNIYKYDETLTTLIETRANILGILPVGISKLQNSDNSTIYSQIKKLQDSYEIACSNWGNEISDTRMAYLVIAGMSLDETTAEKMKSKGILETDVNGSVSYCIKNIAPEFMSKYLDNIESKIFEVASHIQDGSMSGSNLSGVYLKNRLIMLRNKVVGQNIKFKNCVTRRIRCITNYLNMINGTQYNWRDIKITTTECVANDDLVVAQTITQLGDLVSRETKLSLLSFVTDPKTENEKALKDKEDNMIGKAILNNMNTKEEPDEQKEEETDDR